MVLLVKLFAIATILYGCLVILRPKTLKEAIECVKVGNRVLIASGIKFVVGLFLMVAARYCSIPWIILFWGALSAFGGATGFLIKKSVIMDMFDWVEKRFARYTYLTGAFILLVGVLMVLAA
jgi:hypothetical protein